MRLRRKLSTKPGFTIVELLVVIAVIAILAAITIVAYIGVTASANTARNNSNAQSVKSFAEAYNVDNDKYPMGIDSSTTTKSANLSGDIAISSFAPSSLSVLEYTNSPDMIFYQSYTSHATRVYDSSYACKSENTDTKIDGAKIYYWSYATSSYITIVVGDTSGVILKTCQY